MKKKEKVFNTIVILLNICTLLVMIQAIYIGRKHTNPEEIPTFAYFFIVYCVCYILLLFYVLPFLFFKNEYKIGKATKIQKIVFKESNKKAQQEFKNILSQKNIKIERFENENYDCYFGISSLKNRTIIEAIVFLKKINKEILNDYQKNCFSSLCKYINSSLQKGKYKSKRKIGKNIIITIAFDEETRELKELTRSDVTHFYRTYRMPIFLSLKNREILIPFPSNKLGIGEWKFMYDYYFQYYIKPNKNNIYSNKMYKIR